MLVEFVKIDKIVNVEHCGGEWCASRSCASYHS